MLFTSGLFLIISLVRLASALCPPCPQGAQCLDDECVCPTTTRGDPYFHCYDPSEHHLCQLFHDPVLRTFARESVLVHLPASVAVSSVQTIRNDQKPAKVKADELCSLKVFAWTSKVRGKFVLKGVQFEFGQQTHLRGETLSIGRIIGTVVPATGNGITGHTGNSYSNKHNNNGNDYTQHYQQQQQTKTKYRWKIFFYRPELDRFARVAVIQTDGKKHFRRKISKCVTEFRRDEADFLTLTFACCNQTLGFRPYNPEAPKTKVAGLWVKVRHREQELWPLGFPWYVCGETEGSSSINDLRRRHGFHSRSAAATMTALQNAHPVDFPGSPVALPAVQKLFSKNCPKETPAVFYKETEFLFADSKFLRNVPSVDVLFGLIHDLGRAFCYRDGLSFKRCTQAAHVIRALTSLGDDSPSLREFLTAGCLQFRQKVSPLSYEAKLTIF